MEYVCHLVGMVAGTDCKSELCMDIKNANTHTHTLL